MSKSYKIMVVESSPLLAAGLKYMLSEHFSYDVVAVLESTEKLHDKLISIKPDIVIINPLLIDYTKRFMLKSMLLKDRTVVCIALVSAYVDPAVLKQYHGVIGLEDGKQKIESKLREALQCDHPNEQKENYELSDREREVLIAVAKGKMNKEIADQLHISIHTVISHRKNISRKTGIKSVSGLTVYALLNNMIDEREVK
jgi:DNA-binding NarL/FixJ family response regulator